MALEPEVLHSFHLRCSSNNSAFFLNNSVMYNPPFILYHPKLAEHEENMKSVQQGKLKINDYMRTLCVPTQRELMTFYEDYMHGRFSSMNGCRPKDISMLGHKLFVVQYDQFILSAIDGLGLNLLALPLFPPSSQYPITKTLVILRIFR